MPQPDQHTANAQASQVQASAEQCWNDLVQRLPANLETQGRTLGAFQRKRLRRGTNASRRATSGCFGSAAPCSMCV